MQATVLQFIEDLQPEFGAFGLFDPQAKHLLAAVSAHAQGKVDGLVLDCAFIPDLQSQGVEIDDWVLGLERALLSNGDLFDHFIRDGRDQVWRHLGTVQFQQVRLDLAHARTACVHADHVVIEAWHATLVFSDKLRFKATLTVTGNVEPHLAARCQDGLLAAAVAVIACLALVGQVMI